MSKINAYRVPPQQERKAAAELREHGIRAYVPTEIKTRRTATGTCRQRVPAARGYVFAARKPYDSKHVREIIGACDRIEVVRLYQRSTGKPAASTYQAGERIEITKGQMAGIPATVIKSAGKDWYWVRFELFGRAWEQKFHLPPRPT